MTNRSGLLVASRCLPPVAEYVIPTSASRDSIVCSGSISALRTSFRLSGGSRAYWTLRVSAPGTRNEYYRLLAVFLAGARLGLRWAGAFFFFAAFGAASFATA